jgi:excisionase family DNA binding protein
VTLLHGRRRNLLTVEEWCAATGMKPNTVRRQLREGRLRGRRTKSGWRIAAGELATRPRG